MEYVHIPTGTRVSAGDKELPSALFAPAEPKKQEPRKRAAKPKTTRKRAPKKAE